MYKVVLSGTIGGVAQQIVYECERYKHVNNETLKLSTGDTHLFIDLTDVSSYTIANNDVEDTSSVVSE